MCRDAELQLAPTPDAPMTARRFVGDLCQRWGLDDLAFDLSLLVSELVTNSVLHARTTTTVRVSMAHGTACAAVIDGDERLPVRRPARQDLLGDLDALSQLDDHPEAPDFDPRHASLTAGDAGAVTAGRGMLIVDELATDWGSGPLDAGKAVWFTMTPPSDWPWTQRCVCGSPDGEAAFRRPVTHLAGPWDQPVPSG